MENFEREVIDRLARIETKQDSFNERIGEIEEEKKWLWRTAVGAIIVAFVGAISGWVKGGA